MGCVCVERVRGGSITMLVAGFICRNVTSAHCKVVMMMITMEMMMKRCCWNETWNRRNTDLVQQGPCMQSLILCLKLNQSLNLDEFFKVSQTWWSMRKAAVGHGCTADWSLSLTKKKKQHKFNLFPIRCVQNTTRGKTYSLTWSASFFGVQNVNFSLKLDFDFCKESDFTTCCCWLCLPG